MFALLGCGPLPCLWTIDYGPPCPTIADGKISNYSTHIHTPMLSGSVQSFYTDQFGRGSNALRSQSIV